ncbi:MAG TPA: SDR family NAD(P)-dependent oxidoreductase, partial [Myxococcales bacterium]
MALVTGSSRGIGRAIALALAGVGADLVLTSTKEGGAEETANAVRRLGPRALAIACDVVLPGSVERLVDRAHQQFQRV